MMEEFFNVTFGSSLCSLYLIDTPITYESLPVVHHLRLERVPDLGYDFNRALCRFFGHRLDIIDCEWLTDAHLEHIANHCEPLHRLYITDCPKITVAGLKSLFPFASNLFLIRTKRRTAKKIRTVIMGVTRCPSLNVMMRQTTCSWPALLVLKGHPESFYSPIHRLQITGHPKKLSKSDRQWFQKRVKVFHFN
ncbi:hypothetical protein CPB84DRAFT_261105 [Gymnopilus junonius]|uniref:Uncharacterized protein n=1 Tax=Gymnopilus junonius TaxID=109634 RepID=A0A9P5NBX0_GYMJU|nr:hypothetical protein CPB84DRAFT_261105 [Gymnopilus junonius]